MRRRYYWIGGILFYQKPLPFKNWEVAHHLLKEILFPKETLPVDYTMKQLESEVNQELMPKFLNLILKLDESFIFLYWNKFILWRSNFAKEEFVMKFILEKQILLIIDDFRAINGKSGKDSKLAGIEDGELFEEHEISLLKGLLFRVNKRFGATRKKN